MVILTRFLEFFGRKSPEIFFFKPNISYQLDKSFRLVYELSYLDEENFPYFCSLRVSPYSQNRLKNFLINVSQFIHQSNALVELIENTTF
jgi:hypothetical protein